MFKLTCVYLLIYYLHLGKRVPVLGALRFELIVGACLLIGLFISKSSKILKFTRMNNAIIFVFITMSLSMFGAFFTRTASTAVEVFIEVVKMFSLYLMIIATIDTEKRLKTFMGCYVFAVIDNVFEPFFLSLQGKNFQWRDGYKRLFGIGKYIHPNSFGGFVASNLPFLYYFSAYFKKAYIKIFFWIIIFISLRVIMMTASRTAYVAVLALILIVWILSRRKLISMIVFLVLFSVSLPFIPQGYKDRFLTLKNTNKVVAGSEEKYDTISKRWEIIEDAWFIFKKYPIVGCGLDSFYQVRGALFNRWQQTHNLYMQVLTNIGILGFIAFINLLFAIFSYLRQSMKLLRIMRRKKSFLYVLSLALFVYLIIRLIVGFFGHDLYENYWWFAAGISTVILDLTKKEFRLWKESNL